jgi:hypothetical protein
MKGMTVETLTKVHVHVERESSDCDGRHGDYYVYIPREERSSDDIGYHEIREALCRILPLWGEQRVAFGFSQHESEDAEWPDTHMAWASWGTDEGWVRYELRTCSWECDSEESSQYDQFAEMMGY